MQKYMYAILSPEEFFRVLSTRKGKQKEKRIKLAACQKGHTLKHNSNVKFSLFFSFFHCVFVVFAVGNRSDVSLML